MCVNAKCEEQKVSSCGFLCIPGMTRHIYGAYFWELEILFLVIDKRERGASVHSNLLPIIVAQARHIVALVIQIYLACTSHLMMGQWNNCDICCEPSSPSSNLLSHLTWHIQGNSGCWYRVRSTGEHCMLPCELNMKDMSIIILNSSKLLN